MTKKELGEEIYFKGDENQFLRHAKEYKFKLRKGEHLL